MPSLVLSTLNARYAHASLGLRYLFANLDNDIRAEAKIVEFVIALGRALRQHHRVVAADQCADGLGEEDRLLRDRQIGRAHV